MYVFIDVRNSQESLQVTLKCPCFFLQRIVFKDLQIASFIIDPFRSFVGITSWVVAPYQRMQGTNLCIYPNKPFF